MAEEGMCSGSPTTTTAARSLEAVLAEKKFTNGKDDRPLTAQLYRDAFNSQMSQASVLRYNNLG